MSVERAFEINHQSSERRGITEELEDLQRDMVELNQVLSSVKRYTVKEVILAEINLISAKMESLREQTAHNTNKVQLWSDVGVYESLAFTNIDLQKFCIEQDIETCAVKVNIHSAVIYI